MFVLLVWAVCAAAVIACFVTAVRLAERESPPPVRRRVYGWLFAATMLFWAQLAILALVVFGVVEL